VNNKINFIKNKINNQILEYNNNEHIQQNNRLKNNNINSYKPEQENLTNKYN